MKWFFRTLLICILFFIVTSFAWNVRLGFESSFLVAFASLLLYMSKKVNFGFYRVACFYDYYYRVLTFISAFGIENTDAYCAIERTLA
jgi:hypothetical protein